VFLEVTYNIRCLYLKRKREKAMISLLPVFVKKPAEKRKEAKYRIAHSIELEKKRSY
jgi:hypothetical protein